eukprot:gnl/TRDRNA2_/TRDRNA2_164683_c2_seq1.p2 gnl/TRDRNA2_/TRDRNA2_164683_c2~~gnl/TRDRNA2_/TRDRNA2_164683_c2_seq1.p2  ORF type:complete len:104 (+),score=8.82 gnl/TRDRNA2_/TRDRNA2_164683_c2_seq1:56-367(+)
MGPSCTICPSNVTICRKMSSSNFAAMDLICPCSSEANSEILTKPCAAQLGDLAGRPRGDESKHIEEVAFCARVVGRVFHALSLDWQNRQLRQVPTFVLICTHL